MPQLPGYTAKPRDAQAVQFVGGRRASAEDFGAGIGEALVQGGRVAQGIAHDEARRAVDITEENDTRRVLVDNQKLRAKYADALREAELSGQPLDKVRERFESELNSIRNGATTPKGLSFAEQHGAVTMEMFNGRTREIEAHRTRASLVRDVKDSRAASAALMQVDPSYLDRALQEERQLLDTYRGRIAPEIIEAALTEGQQTLAAASVNATIEKDPALALRLLQNPEHAPWGVLSPQQRASLINTSQTAIRAAEADARRAKAEAEQERKETQQKVMDSMLVDFSKGNGKAWTAKKIMALTDVDFDHKVRMMSVLEHITKPKKDPNASAEANEAYVGIFTGKITEKEQLDDMLARGKINPRQHAQLRSAMDGLERPGMQALGDFIRRGMRQIAPADPLTKMLDPHAQQAAERWRQDTLDYVEELRREKQDWRKVTDPRSEAYFGGARLEEYMNAARRNMRATQLDAASKADAARTAPGTGVPGSTAIPTLQSPDEAKRLPKGAQFYTPDGTLRTVK